MDSQSLRHTRSAITMHSSSDTSRRRSDRWEICNSCWNTTYSFLCLEWWSIAKGAWIIAIRTLLWAILPWLLHSLEGVNCSQPKLVRYTLCALFCQSVVHDELEDRCHGWAMISLPATVDESRSTHGFFLFPRLRALTRVSVVAEILLRGIRYPRRNSLRAVYLFSMTCKSKRVRKWSGSPEMTQATEIRTRGSLACLYQKRQRQL